APSGTVKLNPSTAVTWPYRFERRSTSIMRARPGTGLPNPDDLVPPAGQTPVQHWPCHGDDGRDNEGTECEAGEHVVDVVDPAGHPRGGDRQSERHREPGEAGDDEDAGGCERSGQDGVIRRPRPV